MSTSQKTSISSSIDQNDRLSLKVLEINQN